jgi:hypothetical protein
MTSGDTADEERGAAGEPRIERRGSFRGRQRGRRIGVRFRPADAASGADERGETDDIGTGGAFVRCARPPAVGSRVHLEVQLVASEPPIMVRAEVRWISTFGGREGMGLRFLALDVEALLALSEYFAGLAR